MNVLKILGIFLGYFIYNILITKNTKNENALKGQLTLTCLTLAVTMFGLFFHCKSRADKIFKINKSEAKSTVNNRRIVLGPISDISTT